MNYLLFLFIDGLFLLAHLLHDPIDLVLVESLGLTSPDVKLLVRPQDASH